jgi:carboxylesterase
VTGSGAPDDGGAATGIVAASAQPWSAPGGDVGVLVLHGFTGNPTSMRPLAQHLADDGMAVELPLLPGHGTHWRDLARTSWQDWAREAGAALDRLRARTRAVAVVGLSMGGTLALHLVQTRPADVAAIVVINPSLTFRHPLKSVAGFVGRVVPSMPGLGNDIARPGADELPYDRVPLRAAASLFALQDRVRGDLGTVRAPLLVLTSRTDHTVPPGDSTVLLDGVASTEREQVWLERSYHVATLDHDADLIAQRTVAFVREHA